MFYAPIEKHERHEVVDRRITGLVDFLRSDAAGAISTEVKESFFEVANNYFVPDFDDNILSMTPGQQASDAFAITAVRKHETVWMGTEFASFSPGQTQVIKQAIEQSEHPGINPDAIFARMVDNVREHFEFRKPFALTGVQAAVVDSSYVPIPDIDTDLFGCTREVMLLDMASLSPESDLELTMHEHTHQRRRRRDVVVQFPNTTIVEWYKLADELDGYTAGAEVTVATPVPETGYPDDVKLRLAAKTILEDMFASKEECNYVSPESVFRHRLNQVRYKLLHPA